MNDSFQPLPVTPIPVSQADDPSETITTTPLQMVSLDSLDSPEATPVLEASVTTDLVEVTEGEIIATTPAIPEPGQPRSASAEPTQLASGESPFSPPPSSQVPTLGALVQPPTAEDDWLGAFKPYLERPEMIAVIAFALVLVLWDAYRELFEPIDLSQPLSGRRLANRLGVHASTISRYKNRPNFSEWAQDLDPDGIAWIYQESGFVPKS